MTKEENPDSGSVHEQENYTKKRLTTNPPRTLGNKKGSKTGKTIFEGPSLQG